MANEITLTKGGITVTIYVQEVNDNYSNKLFMITPTQSGDNQADGPKDSKSVDLLRVTHSMVIRAQIVGTASKTATQVKQDLVNLWKGAGTVAGEVSLTYDANAKAFGNIASTANTTINGYIEKVNFKEVSSDEPSDFVSSKENYTHISKFEITLTFLEGVKI